MSCKKKIIDTCAAQSHRMFLLARLHVNHVKRQINLRQLRKALETISSSLEESINQSLERVQLQAPLLRDIGTRVLLWIAYSMQPMRITELQHALSVEPGDEDFSEDSLVPNHIILSSCAGLVALESDNSIVRFVHISIRDHITILASECFSNPHLKIPETCLRYLQFSNFKGVVETLDVDRFDYVARHKLVDFWFPRYPLLLYASKHWASHAKLAPEELTTGQLLLLLQDDKLSNFLFFCYYISCVLCPEPWRTCPSKITGLHLASFFGLPSVVDNLLSSQPSGHATKTEDGDSYGRTALYFAASRGHVRMVETLLGRGHDPRGRTKITGTNSTYWWLPSWARDDYSSKTIEVAAEEGHREIVRRLLFFKYRRDYTGNGVHGGALEAAVFKNHPGIVEDLLKAHYTIEDTVIQACVYGGSVEILRLLLGKLQDRAADWKSGGQNEPGGTARSVSYPTSYYLPVAEYRCFPNDWYLTKEVSLSRALSSGTYAAALAGRDSIVQVFLEHGADANIKSDGFHCTPLAAASAYGHLETIKFLLRNGARVNEMLLEEDSTDNGHQSSRYNFGPFNDGSRQRIVGRHGTALQAAAFTGRLPAVALLLDHGATPDAIGGYFGTALQAAAVAGDLAIVEALLLAGADVNLCSGQYGNSLQAAALYGRTDVVSTLLRAGAHLNTEGGEFGYPLVAAATQGNVTALEVLINAGADVDLSTKATGSALYTASTGVPSPNIVRTLSPFMRWRQAEDEENTDLSDFVKFSHQPGARLHYASQQHTIFGAFLSSAAREMYLSIDTASLKPVPSPDPAAFLACIRTLLAAGADPNRSGGHFCTPVLGAIKMGHLGALKLLVQAGAVVPPRLPDKFPDKGRYGDDHGSHVPLTPLALTLGRGDIDIARFLLSLGADPNGNDFANGTSLLHNCNKEEIARLLIENGAIVNSTNKIGATPLHFATNRGDETMVRLLIECGAHVNSLDETGRSPLHENYGIINGIYQESKIKRANIAKLLLQAGSEVNRKTLSGTTPLDLVSIDEEDTLVPILLEAGADSDSRIRFMAKTITKPESRGEVMRSLKLILEHGIDVNAGSNIDLQFAEDEYIDTCRATDRTYGLPSTEKFQNAIESQQRSPVRSKARSGSNPPYKQPDDPTTPSPSQEYTWSKPSEAKRYNRSYDSEWRSSRNVLILLARDGPDDPERIDLLIGAKIDLEKFGTNALLLAVRNGNHKLAFHLIKMGVRATQAAIEAALFNQPNPSRRRSRDAKRTPEEIKIFKDELTRNKGWAELAKRGGF
jgi:ankyrin repeat protein